RTPNAELGKFSNALKATSPACGATCNTLSFNITGANLTLSDFSPDSPNHYTFAADIKINGASGVYVGASSPTSVTPEPASYAVLLGAGLVGLIVLRRKSAARQQNVG